MKSNKEYRFATNPQEKIFHDEFLKRFNVDENTLSAIIFGWENDRQQYPKAYLSNIEKDICLNLIQWLGSPVGQGFLDECGFVVKKYNSSKNMDTNLLNTVLVWGIYFDNSRQQWITDEATSFDNNVPISWAIRRGGCVMSKFMGNFDYEPMPSSRDDEFFREYHFSSLEEAVDCFKKHYTP